MTKDEQWLLEEKYRGEKTEGFFADRTRLAAGEPLAYVIGHIPFLDCTIYLDSRPLIPRPETEYWVEQVIKSLQQRSPDLSWGAHQERSGEIREIRVLDLCAGSGAIGVAVAKAIPEAHVTFIEIDPAHTPTIERNLHENGIKSERAEIYSGDLFAALPTDAPPFDLILSNPPYIDPVLDRATISVKQFEPHLALYGGHEGMELIDRIIADTPTHLELYGQLWLEHEPEHTDAIAADASAQQLYAITKHDQYRTQRYSILMRSMPQ